MSYIGGMYSGVQYITLPIDKSISSDAYFNERLLEADNLINQYVQTDRSESVVNLTYVPNRYFKANPDHPELTYEPVRHDVNIIVPLNLGGYVPRNKKLLTYPYRFLAVDTFNDIKSFRYELFTNKGTHTENGLDYEVVTFRNESFLSANPVIMSTPVRYGTLNGNIATNPTQSVMLTDFPQIAMNVDSFRAYVASGQFFNSVMQGIGSASNIAIGGSMAQSGSIRGTNMAVHGAIDLAQNINATTHALMKGDTVRGQQSGSPHVANRSYNFYYKKLCIRRENAEKIDDYFDRFGYASNKLKVPYRHSRTVYTYTKTQDCTIVGGCPSDDARKISEIFNRGITFWANPYEVGNYKTADGTPIENVPLGNNAS